MCLSFRNSIQKEHTKREKKALYLSVNVFSTKVPICMGHYFYVSYWRRDRHFMWSSEPREDLAACSTKVVPSVENWYMMVRQQKVAKNFGQIYQSTK